MAQSKYDIPVRPPDGYHGIRPPGFGTGPICEVCGLSSYVELGGGNTDPECCHPNIDLRALPGVDIVHDLNRGIPFHDEHAMILRTIHMPQHLHFQNVKPFFKECHRVLRHKGMFWLMVTDLDYVFEKIRQEGFNDSWTRSIWGEQEHQGDFHTHGFNFQYLAKLLEEAGFKQIRHKGWSQCWEFKIQAFKL